MEGSSQLHSQAALIMKSLWYPLNKSLGGLQSRSGRGGEEKNSQPLPGLEGPRPDHSASSSAVYHLAIPAVIAILFL